jgi:ParB-like chromosome segregation protein Spo0J
MANKKKNLLTPLEYLISEINSLETDKKIEAINKIKIELHKHSPFSAEPVDCVLWIKGNNVQSNDYNPNIVAPPEMKLLEVSIQEDGYTQPIVSWINDGHYEVIDGFHRNRIGKESKSVRERIMGYLPLTIINADREDKGDRIAATIRHNRARGKHTISGMSDIVLELKNRNRSNEWIAKKLGMDEDEILRLCQITGLASLFTNQEFSKSWDIEDSVADFDPLTDDPIESTEENKFRAGNTSDETRIFHTYDTWECYKAGLYNTTKHGMTRTQCEQEYCNFLIDNAQFENALEHVITEWKHSCEHYLTNTAMNRIAWLGQASVCYAKGIPAAYRSGFNLLNKDQQLIANNIALVYLNRWLMVNNRQEVTLEEGLSDNQVELY